MWLMGYLNYIFNNSKCDSVFEIEMLKSYFHRSKIESFKDNSAQDSFS